MTCFVLFAWLWAFSGLLDIAPFDAWFASPWHTAWAAACGIVLLRPRWLPGFAAMHALRIAAFVWDSPDTPNHQLLYAIASATVLAAHPIAAWRKRARPSAAEWFEAFAPALRVELCVLYFFGVLHKLNRDYFDPTVSCAVETFAAVASGWLEAIATGSPASRRGLIVGSLLVEAAIPWLLVFGRTRRAGIAIAAAFHGFLGVRFYAFSTGLLALYALFVPSALWERASERIASRRARSRIVAALLSPAAASAVALALVAGFSVSGSLVREEAEWAPLPTGALPLLGAAWTLLMLVPLAGLLGSPALGASFAGPSPGRLMRAPWLLAFPLLLLFQGFSPYLGLRTVPAFSMFSNLRTEGGLTNHWFMPDRALRVAGFQEDLVTILDAKDEELRRFARRPRRTFYDFKRRIQWLAAAGKRDIEVSFRRGEAVNTLAHAESDPELMAPIPWWQRKWLKFRPVPISTQRRCSW